VCALLATKVWEIWLQWDIKLPDTKFPRYINTKRGGPLYLQTGDWLFYQLADFRTQPLKRNITPWSSLWVITYLRSNHYSKTLGVDLQFSDVKFPAYWQLNSWSLAAHNVHLSWHYIAHSKRLHGLSMDLSHQLPNHQHSRCHQHQFGHITSCWHNAQKDWLSALHCAIEP